MISEIIFSAILIALLCWNPPWATFQLNIRPISHPFRQLTLFALLIVGFLVVAGDPSTTNQRKDAFHAFTAGVFLILFARGPRIGNVDPISTRPLIIIIGIASIIWGLAPLVGQ